MDLNDHATIGIAGFYDKGTRKGAWAAVIRIGGVELVLQGNLGRAGARDCERHGLQQALLGVQRLRAPLKAMEVTLDVKRALMGPPGRRDAWSAARGFWKRFGNRAGLRVTRKPGDAYSVALRHAEITAITGVEKLRFTDEELDTPWNRQHRVAVAEQRSERASMREERKTQRKRDEPNDYAIATGQDSPPPGYRRRWSSSVTIPGQPTVTVPSTPKAASMDQGQTLEELMAALRGT